MSDDFRVSREVALADRTAHNQRKKEKEGERRGGERSSMVHWRRFLQSKRPGAVEDDDAAAKSRRNISADEIAKHNTPEDCWMVVKGVVYDISHFLSYHPGGSEILTRYGGKDATELFDIFHAYVNISSMLGPCIVGSCED